MWWEVCSCNKTKKAGMQCDGHKPGNSLVAITDSQYLLVYKVGVFSLGSLYWIHSQMT